MELKQKKKVLFEATLEDRQTGEVTQVYRESMLPKEPDYIKLYLNDLVMLKDLPKWVSDVLFELLKKMNYQNEIVLNSTIKKRIAADLGVVVKTIDNALVRFVKKGILLRNEPGVYTANPFLFGKGEWSNIRKIRLSITFDQNGKNFEAEILQDEPELENA